MVSKPPYIPSQDHRREAGGGARTLWLPWWLEQVAWGGAVIGQDTAGEVVEEAVWRGLLEAEAEQAVMGARTGGADVAGLLVGTFQWE